MKIEVDWLDDNKNIIVQHYPEKWSWDDFRQLQVIVPKMMDEVSHTVHVIGDYSQHQHLPIGNPISPAYNLMRSYPDNFGMLIIITRAGVIESFVRAFTRIFSGTIGMHIHLVQSWEEAHKLIADYPQEANNGN